MKNYVEGRKRHFNRATSLTCLSSGRKSYSNHPAPPLTKPRQKGLPKRINLTTRLIDTFFPPWYSQKFLVKIKCTREENRFPVYFQTGNEKSWRSFVNTHLVWARLKEVGFGLVTKVNVTVVNYSSGVGLYLGHSVKNEKKIRKENFCSLVCFQSVKETTCFCNW